MTCLRAEVLWRCRDPQEELLEPPAKRQRFHSRVDTAEFEATLSQRVPREVDNYLHGGSLNTLAVQVTL